MGWSILEMVTFWGVLLDQSCFLFRHSFGYNYFFNAFTQLQSSSVMDGYEFLKPESMNILIDLCFPVWYFIECCSLWVSVFVHLGAFFESLFFLCYLSFQHFRYVISVSIIYSKNVFFLYPVVDLSLCFLLQLGSRTFFRYFERSCFVYIVWSCPIIFWVSFLSPNIFLIVFVVINLVCSFLLVFSFQCTFACFSFLNVFRWLTQLHYLSFISHPDFGVLFKFLRGMPILSLISFTPVEINSFHLMMSCVGICFDNLLTFSVSTKTFSQFWFLTDRLLLTWFF